MEQHVVTIKLASSLRGGTSLKSILLLVRTLVIFVYVTIKLTTIVELVKGSTKSIEGHIEPIDPLLSKIHNIVEPLEFLFTTLPLTHPG